MADDEQGYRWEKGYEKTWEVLEEDETGSLQAQIDKLIKQAKRKQFEKERERIKLGMMRYVVVCIDTTRTMAEMDLKPNRLLCVLDAVKQFINDFFYQNPISHLAVVVMEDRKSRVLSDMSGNSRRHLDSVSSLSSLLVFTGEISLQNTLELCGRLLAPAPRHASKEVILFVSSLTSCDPGDVHQTITHLAEIAVRCSVIGLSAEVWICKRLCSMTKGTYGISLDESHLRILLSSLCAPQAASTLSETALVRMGFPHQSPAVPSLCSCASCALAGPSGQSKQTGEKSHADAVGYACPQCGSKVCDLPTECRICGLPLLTAAHLARAYCHLFPIVPFGLVVESAPAVKPAEDGMDLDDESQHTFQCYGCDGVFKSASNLNNAYACKKCGKLFCSDCDIFIHGTLHSCPGCTTQSSA